MSAPVMEGRTAKDCLVVGNVIFVPARTCDLEYRGKYAIHGHSVRFTNNKGHRLYRPVQFVSRDYIKAYAKRVGKRVTTQREMLWV